MTTYPLFRHVFSWFSARSLVAAAVFVFAAVMFATFPVAAEEYLGGKIVVTESQSVSPLTAQQTIHGYCEYRFRIQNKDTSPHHIRITLPATNYGSGSSETLITRLEGEVTVAPNDSVSLSLFQPVARMEYGNNAWVTLDGNRQDNVCQMMASLHSHARATSRQTDAGNVLISEKIDPKFQTWIEHGYSFSEDSSSTTGSGTGNFVNTGNTGNAVTSGPSGNIGLVPVIASGSQPPDNVAMWRSSVPFGEWSENWLSYTRFDGVMVTDTELGRGTPAVLRALRQYVESGGVLIVVCAASTGSSGSSGSAWNIPKDWTPLETSQQMSPNSGRSRYDLPVLRHSVLLGDVFFLHITVPPNNPVGAVPRDIPQIQFIRDTVGQKARQWGTALNTGGYYRNRGRSGMFGNPYGGSTVATGILCGNESLLTSLPVIENFSVPVRLIMVLILVFAVLIGPVNIYVLSLFNKRIWLIWTVPAISIVASGIVLSVNLLQEGFLCNDSSATITILNQRRGDAFTYGFVGYYSTLTPRGGLKFDTTTEITASFDRDNSSRSLAIMNGPGKQWFTRGWINPRLPSYFAVRKSQPRNERLEFQWDDQPTVVNGLGVAIEELTVCSPDGKLYLAMDISAGGKAVLIPTSPEKMVARDENGRTRIPASSFWEMTRADYNTIDRWVSQRLPYVMSLPLGTYTATVAENERNPFMETALEKAVPYQHQAMIIGIF